jgi:hypothetical protein
VLPNLRLSSAAYSLTLGLFAGRPVSCTISTHSEISVLLRKPRNRRFSGVVALRQFLERFALCSPPPCFLLLLRRELRWAAHVLPASHRPARKSERCLHREPVATPACGAWFVLSKPDLPLWYVRGVKFARWSVRSAALSPIARLEVSSPPSLTAITRSKQNSQPRKG